MSIYGKTEFLQLVGLTTREMEAVKENLDNLEKNSMKMEIAVEKQF